MGSNALAMRVAGQGRDQEEKEKNDATSCRHQ
jgi:hypothetical protein